MAILTARSSCWPTRKVKSHCAKLECENSRTRRCNLTLKPSIKRPLRGRTVSSGVPYRAPKSFMDQHVTHDERASHPQSDGFASCTGEVTHLLRVLREEMCHRSPRKWHNKGRRPLGPCDPFAFFYASSAPPPRCAPAYEPQPLRPLHIRRRGLRRGYRAIEHHDLGIHRPGQGTATACRSGWKNPGFVVFMRR
jgi:hypothetical protein